jgi:hypothetical protein
MSIVPLRRTEAIMPFSSLTRIALLLVALSILLSPAPLLAWGWQGHRVVGSIAEQLLVNTNAAKQVQTILNNGDPHGEVTLGLVGPWADCARSVKLENGTFQYVVDEKHLEYEVPCTPLKAERDRMVDYVSRNWSNCAADKDPQPSACLSSYHFDDVAIQRDTFNRNEEGTNDHDVVAAVAAAIAMLRGKAVPPPFSIKDKREALILLVHFVGDLHQPLHVGVVYLEADGKLADPDIAHTIDPVTRTFGGNAIQDQNVDLHTEWDEIPFDLGDRWTRELMTAANGVPKSEGTVEEWPASWATDTIHVARQAFAGLHFQRTDTSPKGKWNVTFEDHTAYLLTADLTKRRQLAKGGAHLAEILKAIWP